MRNTSTATAPYWIERGEAAPGEAAPGVRTEFDCMWARSFEEAEIELAARGLKPARRYRKRSFPWLEIWELEKL